MAVVINEDTFLTLNNGYRIPIVGLGTSRIKPEETTDVITTAIDVGYRHFDSAQNYQNTVELGDALSKVLLSGRIERDHIFVTSKLGNFYNRPEDVRPSLIDCLEKLKLKYVDLFLIHQPTGMKKEAKGVDLKERPNYFEYVDHIGVWKEMEKLVDTDITKSIGVSNFNKEQLSVILDNSRIKPAVIQTECHAYLQEKELLKYCHDNNIVLTAYAPLGSPGLSRQGAVGLDIAKDDVVTSMARRHNRSPTQVQRGVSMVVKSSNAKRLADNLNILNFSLPSNDLEALSKLDCGKRIFNLSYKAHPQYPFSSVQK